MPNKKTTKRNLRSRPNRKRGTVTMVNNIPPVPDRYLTRLNYMDSTLLTQTTSVGSYQFILNDIFDPNYTGTGHQPMGHDQLAYLYSAYRVLRFALKITIINESAVTVFAGAIIKPSIVLTTVMSTAFEKPYSKIKAMVPSYGTQSEIVRWPMTPVWKYLGITEQEYRGEIGNSGATMDVSPINRWPVLHLVAQAADALTSCSVRFAVEIQVEVELYNRVALAQS